MSSGADELEAHALFLREHAEDVVAPAALEAAARLRSTIRRIDHRIEAEDRAHVRLQIVDDLRDLVVALRVDLVQHEDDLLAPLADVLEERRSDSESGRSIDVTNSTRSARGM